jgi:hypothetical protein
MVAVHPGRASAWPCWRRKWQERRLSPPRSADPTALSSITLQALLLQMRRPLDWLPSWQTYFRTGRSSNGWVSTLQNGQEATSCQSGTLPAQPRASYRTLREGNRLIGDGDVEHRWDLTKRKHQVCLFFWD